MITRQQWNEMQRDAYDPDDEPKTYYCEICGHRHRYKSKRGFLHNPDIPLWLKEEYAKEWSKNIQGYLSSVSKGIGENDEN